ncbi:hypothetical protein R1sor_005031 [Riccia sorocarpa]|uniref:Uncharacterized protein n=1 Tax=Riccia sorocarpa TaxID=122646 RepID=A0ABD3HIC5_9MARC
MGRKSHKEVISLVCCSDATFDAFEQFVLRWKKGEVPDVHGALGKPQGERDVGEVDRDFSQLSVNRFRPVNGLVDEDLKLVWNQLEKGSVWVSRPAKHQGPDDIVALRDYCKVLKGKCTLGKTIVRYWMTRFKEDYNSWVQLATDYSISDNWLEEMLKFVLDKPEKEVVAEDVSSSDGDDEDSSKKKKKKKKSTSVDVLPSQIKTQLYKFHCAKHGGDIPQRLQPLEVLEIKDITQYQLTIDEKLNCKLLVYAFVSLGVEDYKPKLHENIQCQPFSSEYVTKKSAEDFDVAKGEGALAENIKNKVPRWEFVNLSSPDGKPLVHPICKRRNFCIRLLTNLSADGSTVLDFFSGGGGVFARDALFLKRDVIYFADSEKEAIFLREYTKELLRLSDRIKNWYVRYKSAKCPASASQQLAVASSSQQPTLASSSRQPTDAVTQEDQIASQTAPAPLVFDDEMRKEALENLGNARRRVDFNPTSN